MERFEEPARRRLLLRPVVLLRVVVRLDEEVLVLRPLTVERLRLVVVERFFEVVDGRLRVVLVVAVNCLFQNFLQKAWNSAWLPLALSSFSGVVQPFQSAHCTKDCQRSNCASFLKLAFGLPADFAGKEKRHNCPALH